MTFGVRNMAEIADIERAKRPYTVTYKGRVIGFKDAAAIDEFSARCAKEGWPAPVRCAPPDGDGYWLSSPPWATSGVNLALRIMDGKLWSK